jgi:hypothetical protein
MHDTLKQIFLEDMTIWWIEFSLVPLAAFYLLFFDRSER